MHPQALNYLVGAFASASVMLAAFVLSRVFLWFRVRKLTKFWRPFLSDEVSIVITEYAVSRGIPDPGLANPGNESFVSQGMAHSLSVLLCFLMSRRPQPEPHIIGSREPLRKIAGNLIVLGSPATNPVARKFMDRISELYEVPFKFDFSSEDKTVTLTTFALGQHALTPGKAAGYGTDFGIVLKAPYQLGDKSSWVLIIAGCHMWGTFAAVKASVDRSLLQQVSALSKNADAVGFVIKTDIVNDQPTTPHLLFDGECRVWALQTRPRRN
jgi:hypothetical protein